MQSRPQRLTGAHLGARAAGDERFLRRDPDAIAAFRAGGPGRQSRMDDALRKVAGLP
ncbi:MAG: BrnA antitoxin family protein [Rhodospirillales bacterium]|nr:BrnA antitoxin family protein [Rhodospirillales bacterium]